MIATATTPAPRTAAGRVAQLRAKSLSVGINEGEESEMRLYAGAPQRNDAEFQALCARLGGVAARPMQTPGALINHVTRA